MQRKRLCVLPLFASLALAGCGGGDGESVEDWASGVCAGVSTWVGDVDAAVASLTEGGLDLDEASVREAVDRVGEATDELASDFEQLGAPETDSGRRAQQELEMLRDKLRDQLEAVERALEERLEPLQLVARVSTALAAAANQLQRTIDRLEGLDPGGELEEAFRSSAECDALREQFADIGS